MKFDSTNLKKTNKFKDNENLNELLKTLYTQLKPIQSNKEKQSTTNQLPLLFIVGNARSGTTLLLQWLSSLGVFSYPSNFLTRFAFAPYIGALIQKMLFDPEYDINGDFQDIRSGINFSSNLGKSKGALATSEFQHFFRNYMPNFESKYLTQDEINNVNFKGMNRGLSSILEVFNKPFVTKLAMLKYNLVEAYKHIPNSLFLYIQREPLYIMQSTYQARLNYYGTLQEWWSGKPKEYSFLKEMDPYHQIAGQIYFTDQSIQNSLKNIDQKNHVTLSYEKICENNENVLNEIFEKLAGYDIVDVASKYSRQFEVRNNKKIHIDELKKLDRAYNYFENKY